MFQLIAVIFDYVFYFWYIFSIVLKSFNVSTENRKTLKNIFVKSLGHFYAAVIFSKCTSVLKEIPTKPHIKLELVDLQAVAQRCSIKKVFLEISQNSQENTCTRVSFLIHPRWLLLSIIILNGILRLEILLWWCLWNVGYTIFVF